MLKNKLLIIMATTAFVFVSPFFLIPAYEYFELRLIAYSLKKVAANELKDADSAKFRNLELKSSRVSRSVRFRYLLEEVNEIGIKSALELWLEPDVMPYEIALCGEINGRNEFGGYSGFTTFYARPGDPPKAFIDSKSFGISLLDEFAKNNCKNLRISRLKID